MLIMIILLFLLFLLIQSKKKAPAGVGRGAVVLLNDDLYIGCKFLPLKGLLIFDLSGWRSGS